MSYFDLNYFPHIWQNYSFHVIVHSEKRFQTICRVVRSQIQPIWKQSKQCKIFSHLLWFSRQVCMEFSLWRTTMATNLSYPQVYGLFCKVATLFQGFRSSLGDVKKALRDSFLSCRLSLSVPTKVYLGVIVFFWMILRWLSVCCINIMLLFLKLAGTHFNVVNNKHLIFTKQGLFVGNYFSFFFVA